MRNSEKLPGRLFIFIFLAVFWVPRLALAQDIKDKPNPRHCYGDDFPKAVFGETFVALTNTLGFENQVRLGYCWPLIRKPGMLFDYTNIELGVFNYLSPAYTHQGVFFAFTPLSFINFRLEFAGLYIWPVTILDAAGHFARSGYNDGFESNGIISYLPIEDAQTATGINIVFNTTLQGSIPLYKTAHGDLELILLNTFGLEYWQVGDAPFYYNMRKDIILARTDSIITNMAILMLGIPVRSKMSLRIGATDSLIYILGANQLGFHQVGGLIALNFEKLGNSVRGLMTFLQISGYTSHQARYLLFPVNFMLGLDLAVVIHRQTNRSLPQ